MTPPSPSPSSRVPLGAAALLALINVLWAGSAIPAKIVLGSAALSVPGKVGPYTLAFARFAPAALLLYLTLRLRGQRIRLERRDLPRFFLVGALGIALTYGIFYGGIRGTTASEASLLITAEPILIAFFAALFLHERLHRWQWGGMAAGFAGVYLVVNQGIVPHFSTSAAANAVVAIALCFEVSSGILAKKLVSRYSGLVVVTVEMAVGAMLLLPFAFLEMRSAPGHGLDALSLGSIAYLGLICSFLCYGVWYMLLPRLKLSAMAGFLFIQPVMGPLLGTLILGERLSLWAGIGAALVLSGVWLVVSREGKPHD